VQPNPFQPRRHFDEEALSALVDSIKSVGVLQPVLVRQTTDGYELIAGERRYRAARRAGLITIPALVTDVADEASLERALIENVHREDLNPLEEAAAYQQLIEGFGLTHDETARRVGRSRPSVTNALRLLQLPPAVQRLLRDRLLSAGHARAILATPDRALQEKLAIQAVRDGLSVRGLEDLVRVHAAGGSDEQDESVEDSPGATREQAPADKEGGPSLQPPGVLDLEELLGDHLNTRVRIEMGRKRGRISIEFADLDDLERISRLVIGGRAGEVSTMTRADF
jgi:ParB family chromosome partitioning protein